MDYSNNFDRLIEIFNEEISSKRVSVQRFMQDKRKPYNKVNTILSIIDGYNECLCEFVPEFYSPEENMISIYYRTSVSRTDDIELILFTIKWIKDFIGKRKVKELKKDEFSILFYAIKGLRIRFSVNQI